MEGFLKIRGRSVAKLSSSNPARSALKHESRLFDCVGRHPTRGLRANKPTIRHIPTTLDKISPPMGVKKATAIYLNFVKSALWAPGVMDGWAEVRP